MSIRSSLNNQLKADIYLPKKSNGKTIIFLSGLPTYFHKSDISKVFADHGFTVIHPFYYGTWVSGGDFNPQTALKTVSDTVKAVVDGTVSNLYTNTSLVTPKEEIFLVGTSFGSVIMQCYRQKDISPKKIGISAIPVFNHLNNKSIHFDPNHLVVFLERGFPFVYRCNDWQVWRDAFSGDNQCLSLPCKDSQYLFLQGNADIMANTQLIQTYSDNMNLDYEIREVSGNHSLESMDPLQIVQNSIQFLS